MIQMPRRSVTRFFIPLIDVLLLTFGVFLLMPIAAETELESERQEFAEKGEASQALTVALHDRLRDLYKLEELRPQLEMTAELRKEIETLRNLLKQSLYQKIDIKIIDINPKDGTISYFDANQAKPIVPISTKEEARALIKTHRADAQGREVYYYFLRPRSQPGAPLAFGMSPKQRETYQSWFADASHSLQAEKKK